MLNTIVEGDFLETLRKIPDKSIDLVLWDPPYAYTDAAWDLGFPISFVWAELKRVLSKNSPVVINACGIFTYALYNTNPAEYNTRWLWKKSNLGGVLNARKKPLREFEDVLVFGRKARYNPQMRGEEKERISYNNGYNRRMAVFEDRGKKEEIKEKRGKFPTELLEFKSPSHEDRDWHWHPTQKPVELGRYFVRTYSNPGQTVLDLSCGAGSYPLAAMLEGRNFIGIDKNIGVSIVRKNKCVNAWTKNMRPLENGQKGYEYDLDCIALSRARIRAALPTLSDEARATLAPVGLLAPPALSMRAPQLDTISDLP